MQDADWAVLGTYVREAANTLGLRDWFLLLKHDVPMDEEVLASVDAIYGRKYAVVRVCKEFRELSHDEQRQVIVHELVHCHLATLGHMLNKTLRAELGHAGEILVETWRVEFEHAVDAIATEWANLMPHIEWTTPDPSIDQTSAAPYEGPIDGRP